VKYSDDSKSYREIAVEKISYLKDSQGAIVNDVALFLLSEPISECF
jgi:hypothetical protein